MDLKAVIEAGSESATSLIERAAHAAEDASIRATEAVVVAKEHSEQAVASAEHAAASLRRSSKKPLIMGAVVLVTVVTAGGGYLLWKRRQAAAEAHLTGEGEWGAPTSPAASTVSPFMPGVADEQSPDVVDEEFAAEVDDAADEFATEVVDSIEVPADAAHRHVEDAPEPAEPFVPGVADEQSPDVVDEGFAAEVDEAADELATAVVEAIETPEGKHT